MSLGVFLRNSIGRRPPTLLFEVRQEFSAKLRHFGREAGQRCPRLSVHRAEHVHQPGGRDARRAAGRAIRDYNLADYDL
ncbi:hypothetical protein OKC48_10975 [Methylorubrum extorquens]|uniref:hypothetical protein n=1 Tax=Methylorubrum extorquens TaxID=408 RepID=UPI0022389C97|nr:hypothetical protein [Methylorubrum extorquens]UYW29002.1 hypothetical protein OKC48_10975 [Methylorubrum extorquens]